MGEKNAASRVWFRLPRSSHFYILSQQSEPRGLHGFEALEGSQGYLIVPFLPSAQCGALLLEPDVVETKSLPPSEVDVVEEETCRRENEGTGLRRFASDEALQRDLYSSAFGKVMGGLQRKDVEKVVLSRRLNLQLKDASTKLHAEQLFFRACQTRPDSFVAYWNTPQTGQWLVASPEPLLERRGENWSTPALAGTVPFEAGVSPQWSSKNLEEQALVARFVEAQLAAEADEVKRSELFTVRSGNLVHLCNNFTFQLASPARFRNLLARLHPTPAVCGSPREEALQIILAAEASPRRFYAGFSGPLNLQGYTSLYVSLRCMTFSATRATLFAGGGIMPGSLEEEEWEETCHKLQTMLQLF